MVDTSAAVAMLASEKRGAALREHLGRAETRLMSAATLLEVGIVMEARLGPAGANIVDRFIRDGGIEIVPLDRTHVDRALEGWRRFGKGRHPAALNLGDCFSYALAAATGHPILCVGDDFAATDLEAVGCSDGSLPRRIDGDGAE